MNFLEAKKICVDFATEHNLHFQQKGEVGFCRSAVGFLDGDNYIDYNPMRSDSFEPIPELHMENFGDITPTDAYHKHNCLAVLVHNELYDEGIIQLAIWVNRMKSLGTVSIVEYSTGHTGMQAFISGATGKAVLIK